MPHLRGSMTREAVEQFMEHVIFPELRATRSAGQKEYAHDPDDAFANFKRRATESGVDPAVVWHIYAGKHWDGISAWVRGHTEQREPIQGRIKDMIVYLSLLWAWIEASEENKSERESASPDDLESFPTPEPLKRVLVEQNHRRSCAVCGQMGSHYHFITVPEDS